MDTEKFVKTVVSKLLDGNDERITRLRSQFNQATLSSVYGTGKGIKAIFDIQDGAETLDEKSHVCLADLDVYLKGLECELISCVLHVKDGKLWYFDAATFDGDWPANIGEFDMKYRNAQERMIEW